MRKYFRQLKGRNNFFKYVGFSNNSTSVEMKHWMQILEKKKWKISNLSFHLKKLEKEQKIISTLSKRKERIKIKKSRAEINETENMKSIDIINENKS